jgi:hypothetical protein
MQRSAAGRRFVNGLKIGGDMMGGYEADPAKQARYIGFSRLVSWLVIQRGI